MYLSKSRYKYISENVGTLRKVGTTRSIFEKVGTSVKVGTIGYSFKR